MRILLWSVSVTIAERSREIDGQVLSSQPRQLHPLAFHPQQYISYFVTASIAVVKVPVQKW
jgi:hypothetical protein